MFVMMGGGQPSIHHSLPAVRDTWNEPPKFCAFGWSWTGQWNQYKPIISQPIPGSPARHPSIVPQTIPWSKPSPDRTHLVLSSKMGNLNSNTYYFAHQCPRIGVPTYFFRKIYTFIFTYVYFLKQTGRPTYFVWEIYTFIFARTQTQSADLFFLEIYTLLKNESVYFQEQICISMKK